MTVRHLRIAVSLALAWLATAAPALAQPIEGRTSSAAPASSSR